MLSEAKTHGIFCPLNKSLCRQFRDHLPCNFALGETELNWQKFNTPSLSIGDCPPTMLLESGRYSWLQAPKFCYFIKHPSLSVDYFFLGVGFGV